MDISEHIFAILGINNQPVGTGFLAAEGLILTCAHVIVTAGGKPGDKVNVRWMKTEEKLSATVDPSAWIPPDSEDLAILHLDEPFDEHPLSMDEFNGEGEKHSFNTFGFPLQGAIPGGGEIVGSGKINDRRLLLLRSQEVTPGFSGAPVWDTTQGCVVGIVNSIIPPDKYDRLKMSACATPISIIRKSFSLLQPLSLPPCPYRGLIAFRDEDSSIFFGREEFIGDIYNAVQSKSFIAVIVGPSGVGKTSCIFAGLVPRLRKDTIDNIEDKIEEKIWKFAPFKPGDRPFHALAHSLFSLTPSTRTIIDELLETEKFAKAIENGDIQLSDYITKLLDQFSSSQRILLIIDQFEELFSHDHDLKFRNKFINALLNATVNNTSKEPVRFTVLITLRADFMVQALYHAEFVKTLQNSQFLLGPMSSSDIRKVIEEPARLHKVSYETGLVDRIIEDLGQEPGGLPLLEFALTLLWDKQINHKITHSAYDSIGKVRGAISLYAETVYQGLNEKEKQALQRIMLLFVISGKSGINTRRSAVRSDIGEEGWLITQKLINFRLVVSDRDELGHENVTLAHEAIIDGWQRLKDWVDANSSFLTWQERNRASLQQWQTANEDTGALLRGSLLSEAEKWYIERENQLIPEEKEYIRRSIALRNTERENRYRRQRRTIYGLSIVVVIMLVLASIAYIQRIQAVRQSDISFSRELSSASLNNLDVDPERSILLALESIKITKDKYQFILPESENALHLALEKSRILWRQPGKIFSLSTNILAILNKDTITLWDIHTHQLTRQIDKPGKEIISIALDPKSEYLAYVESNGLISIIRLASDEVVYTLQGPNEVSQIIFNPQGDKIAIAGNSGNLNVIVMVWDFLTDKRSVFEHEYPVLDITFSPDGLLLATAGYDGFIRVWDIDNSVKLLSITAYSKGFTCVAFSPDGQFLASGNYDRNIYIWESQTGNPVNKFIGHNDVVMDIAYNPDGKYMVSGSMDGIVKLWLTAGYQSNISIPAYQRGVFKVAFLPDGDQVVADGMDETITVWNVGYSHEWKTIDTQQLIINRININPEGNLIASASEDGTAKVWDVESGNQIAEFRHKERIMDVAFSMDGQQLATSSGDKTIIIWDLMTGKQVHVLNGHTSLVCAVVFSPDGKMIASSSYDGTVRLWDRQTGDSIAVLTGHKDWIRIIKFTPNSKFLISVSSDQTAKVWDVLLKKDVASIKNDTGRLFALAVHPDGSLFSIGDENGYITTWNIAQFIKVDQISIHSSISVLEYSPDGRYLAIGTNNLVTIMNLKDKENRFTLLAPEDRISDVKFDPNGKYIAASSSGTIRLNYLNIEDLLQLAKSRITRSFSQEECNIYLHTETCP